MHHSRIMQAEYLISVVLIALAIAAAFARLFLGTEITDEALYVGDAYIAVQGAVPVINNWTQFAPFTFFSAPFLKLFFLFSDSTAGIFLYTRIVYFLCKLILAAFICLLLRKQIPFLALLSATAVIIVPQYVNISNFSYTSISFYFLLLSGVLMVCAMQEAGGSRKAMVFAVFGGITSAFSACVYPTHVITCAVLALALLLGELWLRRSARLFVGYAIGGLGTALLVVLYLIARGGGLAAVFYGIENILSGIGYFSLRSVPPLQLFCNQLKTLALNMRYWSRLLLLLVICCAVIRRFSLVRQRTSWKSLLFACGWLSYLLFLLKFFSLAPGSVSEYMVRLFVPPYIMALLMLPLVWKKHPVCRSLFACLWFPSGLWLLVSGFSSHNGFYSRCIGLLGGVLCFFLFSALYLADLPLASDKKLFCKTGALLICLAAAVSSLYIESYRDAPVFTLTHRVDEGIYKGLYTTEERSQTLPALERELRRLVSPEETVLFMDNVPMAYLMAEAQHCTPSTWDMSNYSYGRNDPSLYLNYFSVTGQIPNKIIYILTDRDPHVSMDEPGYLFNEFVNENYVLTYRNDESAFPVQVYANGNAQ